MKEMPIRRAAATAGAKKTIWSIHPSRDEPAPIPETVKTHTVSDSSILVELERRLEGIHEAESEPWNKQTRANWG